MEVGHGFTLFDRVVCLDRKGEERQFKGTKKTFGRRFVATR
ncbi:hypothetical protein ABI_04680 [Asticcacaulis biprosthecium C19]|uniref:Uncharacterized protein n=1 Tax=Asticcacaulis biprosthecium C19 TaxID=715226 RepID=F4QK10_9CAUL|nr:hypothetical protein ABI_04680 [Asticcacaulis biprosthecium C19]